jgi:hypothetical protein
MELRFKKLCKALFLVAVSLLLTLLSPGCSPGTKIEPALDHVQALEPVFNVTWPTNVSHEHSGAWRYRGRGASFNTITCAKVDLTPSAFQAWRESVTNTLEEIGGFVPARDEGLIKQFPWWDVDKYPASQIIYYPATIDKLPKFLGKLNVFVVKKEDRYVMYIHALILRRE